MMRFIVAIASSLLAFACFTLLFTALMADRVKSGARLDAIGDRPFGGDRHKRVRAPRKRRIRISAALIDQLASAGVPMRAEEYLFIWAVLAFVPAVIAALLGARLTVTLTLCCVGVAIPPLFVRRSRTKRIIAFEAQLGDALVSISNCLKSGLTFQQGMASVAEQMPEPISKEFSRTLREIQLGNTMEKALENLTRRIPSSDLKLMITAILISQQVGGSLSDVLDSIAATITDRLKIKAEIRTLTATGRISGLIIGLLPIGITLILLLINPAYMTDFVATDLGKKLLLIAAGMEIVGAVFIRKMVTIKY